jgi:hypothetical protein
MGFLYVMHVLQVPAQAVRLVSATVAVVVHALQLQVLCMMK